MLLVPVLKEYSSPPVFLGTPGGSDSKESTYNVGDLGSIPGLGRFLEEGMATHSSILAWRIPMDRGAWQATDHGVTESDTIEWLSTARIVKINEKGLPWWSSG